MTYHAYSSLRVESTWKSIIYHLNTNQSILQPQGRGSDLSWVEEECIYTTWQAETLSLVEGKAELLATMTSEDMVDVDAKIYRCYYYVCQITWVATYEELKIDAPTPARQWMG
jgi:hypothetical protein